MSDTVWILLSFAIPTGVGIPAGVLLGDRAGMSLLTLSAMYSAVSLLRAIPFEPVVRWAARRLEHDPRAARLGVLIEDGLDRLGPLRPFAAGAMGPALVSYNLDPWAGRAVAGAFGIGWLHGWVLALFADWLYFLSTAAPTLWLQWWLTDRGMVWAIMTVPMLIGAVMMVRRYRGR